MSMLKQFRPYMYRPYRSWNCIGVKVCLAHESKE
jgi:hypothetical protein